MIYLIIVGLFVLTALVYWLFMSPYSQIFGEFPFKASVGSPKIALTFDDGPNEPFTSQIVEYLNSRDIKATFFQVAKCVERFPEVTSKIEKSGHLIANHSLSHRFGEYFSHPDFKKELSESQEIFQKVIGKKPAYFRPPWLWRYPALFKSLKTHKLQLVSGEFCNVLEVFQPSAQRIARRAIAKAKPGAIIIFHDGFDAKGGDRAQTVEAVKLFAEELSAQGYEFVTVDKLFGSPGYL